MTHAPTSARNRSAFVAAGWLLLLVLTTWTARAQTRTFAVTDQNGIVETHVIDYGEIVAVIVEFRSPPLARAFPGQRGPALGKQAGGTAAAAIDREHSQFRQDLSALLSRYGGALAKASSAGSIQHAYRVTLNGVAVSVPRGVIPRLGDLDYVRGVTEDYEVRAQTVDAKEIVGASALTTRLGLTGEGVVIGILDTGIDYTHPDLGGGFGPGFKVIGGQNFIGGPSDDFKDVDGHGTHVAGIAAANGGLVGIAPGARLRGYKVIGDDGFGSTASVIAGIEQAVLDGVDILNMSVGGPGTADEPEAMAVDNATLAGVLCVVSAGNEGDKYATILSPGVARSALTVGASDKNDWMTQFSSRGPSSSIYHIKPDVVAPGLDINSLKPDGEYVFQSGTSMAAPVVAGAAALLMERHDDWTPEMIKAVLMNTADQIFDPKLSKDADPLAQGAGRINVDRAAEASMIVSPGSVSFGLVDVAAPIWEKTEMLTVQNLTDGPQTYAFSTETALPGGVTLVFEPSNLSVAPGEVGVVTARFTVDNALLPTISIPPGYSGTIAVNSANESTRLPFAFVKSTFLRLTFDEIEEVWIGVHDREKKLEDYFFTCNAELEYVVPLGSETVDFAIVFLDSFDVFVEAEVDLRTTQQVQISRSNARLRLDIEPVDKNGAAVSLLDKEELTKDWEGTVDGLKEGITYFEFSSETMGIGLKAYVAYDTYRFSRWPEGYSLRGIGIAYQADEREYYEYPFKVTGLTESTKYTFDPSRMKAIHYSFPFADAWDELQFVPRLHDTMLEEFLRMQYVSCLSDSYQRMRPPYHLTAYLYPRPDYFDFDILGALSHFYETKFELYHPANTDCPPDDPSGFRVLKPHYQTGATIIRDETVLYVQPEFETVIYKDRNLLYSTEAAEIEIKAGAGAPWWAGRFDNEGTAIRLSALGTGFFLAPIAGYRMSETPYVLSVDDQFVRTDFMPNTGYVSIETTEGDQHLSLIDDQFVIGDRAGEARATLTFQAGEKTQNPPYIERLHLMSDGIPTDVIAPDSDNELQMAVNFPWAVGDPYYSDDAVRVTAAYRLVEDSGWTELPLEQTRYFWTSDQSYTYRGKIPDLAPGYYALRVHAEHPSGATYTMMIDPAFLYGEIAGTWSVPAQTASDGRDSTDAAGVPHFSWANDDASASYQVQIAKDDGFIDVVMDAAGITDTTFAARELQDVGTLYWRVRGLNPEYAGAWSDAREFTAEGITIDVADGVSLPERFMLHQNYPNPFNPATTIRYAMPERSRVRVEVFDILGRQLAVLVDEVQDAGVHDVRWNVGSAASGVFVYRIEAVPEADAASRYSDARRMLYVK